MIMQSHKNFVRRCWQPKNQSIHPHQISSATATITSQNSTIPLPNTSTSSDPSSKDYEKLRQKMWEMKHRVCLLEFGLGSVAKLMQDYLGGGGAGEENNGPQQSDLANNEGHFNTKDNGKYKEVLKGIGEVLQDIESCISSQSGGNDVQQMEIKTASPPCKARIIIDETNSGDNFLTMTTTTSNLCSIQILENPAIFPSLSSSYQHQNYINPNENAYQFSNDYSIAAVNPIISASTSTSTLAASSFDALTTLASVASSKHEEEMMKMKKREREGHGASKEKNICGVSEETGGHHLVNPFIFLEEGDVKMPPRKRHRDSTGDSDTGGMSTRRARRVKQRDHRKQ